MAAKSLNELFVEELRDMYDGENRLTKALPKMAKAAGHPELRAAFTSHLRETQGQIRRLEQVFRAVGEKPRGKKCDGIIGIVDEGNSAMEELDGAVLDAALIAGAQKVEHYEIASYGTLAYFAELLGNRDAKNLLGETLNEEKAADKKLNDIAKSRVNRDALMAAGMDEEKEERMWSAGPRATAMDQPTGNSARQNRGRRTSRSRSASSRGKKR